MERLINMASFAEVVDAGGLSAAAERLGCSRAVVSKRLSALERDFGVTLLNRTTRRQSLTEAGQTLYARCRRMLDEMLDAETLLSEFSSSPRGTLRVSAPHSYAIRILSKRLTEFLRSYPDIRMELQLSDQLADLAGTSVDIAVRMTDAPAPGLVARKLLDVPYIICAAPSYLQCHGTPTHPRELAQHNCLYYAGSIFQNPWHFDGPDGHTVVDIQGSLTAIASKSCVVPRSVVLASLPSQNIRSPTSWRAANSSSC
ncbi:MAG TPA: LysR family transcriptional regulator [Rhodocyclaceae bacterium]|nr:LysR family transcriptional regulator [Rhodocyclaceae bacterium]